MKRKKKKAARSRGLNQKQFHAYQAKVSEEFDSVFHAHMLHGDSPKAKMLYLGYLAMLARHAAQVCSADEDPMAQFLTFQQMMGVEFAAFMRDEIDGTCTHDTKNTGRPT